MPSMKPKSTHRYRICGTPSRGGCITCKVRRVKCGEEKPLCKRCTSTGRKCDGYAPPKSSNSGLQDTVHKSISTTPTQDPMEQRLLYFFTTFTAPMLCGNFSPEFWERKVLQAAVAEPSIRHAVIAIGAIHEDFSSRLQIHDSDYEPPIQAFALRQYTKAIRHLHQLMATQTQQLDFTLLACILFICFDSLIGNHTSAIIHLEAGLKIREDIQLQKEHGAISADEWDSQFSPLLLSLGIGAASFLDPRLRRERTALWDRLTRVGVTSQPTSFSSLDEASYALNSISVQVTAYRASCESILDYSCSAVEEGRLYAALSLWSERLDRYLADFVTRETAVNNTIRGASMLKCHCLMTSISIGPHDVVEKFEKALTIIQALIDSKMDERTDGVSFNFTIDNGIVGGLFYAAVAGPTMAIQQRAVDLLSRAHYREGLWDTQDALYIAEKAMRYTSQNDGNVDPSFIQPASTLQAEIVLWYELSGRLNSRMASYLEQRRPSSSQWSSDEESRDIPYSQSGSESGAQYINSEEWLEGQY